MYIYDKMLKFLWDGTIDFDTDTLKCALISSLYQFNPSHYQFSEVSENEIEEIESPDNGYSSGGAIITGVNIIETSPSMATFTCNNISWTMLIATFKYAILYANITRNGVVNPLFGCIDLNFGSSSSIVVNGVDYQIQISQDGLFVLTK
jgi:hypothetical protein